VNTVAFADSSSNILFSGGDDGLIKVGGPTKMLVEFGIVLKLIGS